MVKELVMMADVALTDAVKALAVELGADLVGIAPSERYEHAPLMMSPEGHLPGATCVVVIAIHHPDAAVELGGEQDGENQPHHLGPYSIQSTMNTKLECISFELSRFIEESGHRVVAIPATNVWRYRPYEQVEACFAPDLSNIHAAAAAGLGEIGYSGLLLTPEFGPRQRFCCLICDADLEPSPMYDGPELCDRCMECAKWCQMNAFEEEVDGESEVRIGDKTFRYANKNKWRCAWAEHFGLSVEGQAPEQINEDVILDYLEKWAKRGGTQGSCLRCCLPPHLRLSDPYYCRPYRRRRPGVGEDEQDAVGVPPRDRAATERVCKVLFDRDADMVSIVDLEGCGAAGLDLRDHLPDARRLIVFGCRYPQEDTAASGDAGADHRRITRRAARDWLGFMQLDGCRQLERIGYSAVPGHDIDLQKAVAASGLARIGPEGEFTTSEFGTSIGFACLATGAPLEAGRRVHPVEPVQPSDTEDARLDLTAILMDEGADMVGVAEPRQVDQLIDQYSASIDEELLKWNVVDRGPTHGPVEAEISPIEGARVRRTSDYMDEPEGVLVIGYHFPFGNLEQAAEPAAQAVGPYSYATYQANRWLGYLAVRAARRLEQMGYRAVITGDLSGTGSVVATPRGAQPDALSNRFAAIAAGLAWIGLHGAPITEAYGVTQRFIAVVTDAPLPVDRPLTEPWPCENCAAPCIEACPVAALSDDECVLVGSGESGGAIATWDRMRCEFAKKYALVGAEGPKWCGQTTDITPPAGQVTAEDIAEALAQKDPVQKHWTCILEACLKACQMEGAWGEAE